VPHIIKIIELTFPKQSIILDGELYNHDFKNSFEEITSFIRSQNPKSGHEIVNYFIYDLIDDTLNFEKRIEIINKIKFTSDKIVKVKTRPVKNIEELMSYFMEDLEGGYEGSIARNYNGVYEYRRSYNLLKIKSFDDAEFKIVALEKGRGRMSSCAIFLCETKNGDRFSCKMKGSLDILKDLLINPQKAVGKFLTVQYQGLTNGSLPRFPIGLHIREDV